MAVLLAAGAAAVEAPSVTIAGVNGETRSLQVSDLQKLAVRDASVTDPHSKALTRYRGVSLATLLSLVGTPAGETLRGKSLALHVEVEASDGYIVCFSVAELDAGTGSTDALLAFEQEGKPLGNDIGPLRLVVPTDKRAARWVRQVVSVKVLK